MFPKSTIATIIGIGGMAGGLGSFLINYCSGILFDYAAQSNMSFMSFQGKPAGYFHRILHLRRSLSRRMAHHEGARAPLQAGNP